MRNFVKTAVVLGVVLGTPQLGSGQEREYPVLNSIGRYLGVGYTRGGYHAAIDGRPNRVTDNHPAAHYGSGQLLYPYQAHYQAQGRAESGALVGPSLAGSSVTPLASPASPATPAVKTPPQPAGPTPQWLKPYLNDSPASPPEDLPTPAPTTGEAETLKLHRELSPSDRQDGKRSLRAPAATQRREGSLEAQEISILIPRTEPVHGLPRYVQPAGPTRYLGRPAGPFPANRYQP